MKKYLLGISLVLALVAGCSETPEPAALAKLPLDLAAGKALAEKACARCHGLDGSGVKDDIPNLAAQVESYLFTAFETYNHGSRTRTSGDVMAVASELTPNQLRNVLGYYAKQPALTAPAQPPANYSYYDRGQALSKPCARCHGTDGNPTQAGIPRLAGQTPQYLMKAAKAYRDGVRTMPTMHEKLTGHSLADLENIAIYFAMNTPKPAPGQVANSADNKPLTYKCAECHGSHGTSVDQSIPNLAGQDVKYLGTMIKAYRDRARVQGKMHEILGQLKDDEIDKIATYFAGETPKPMAFTPPESVNALSLKCDRCHSLDGKNPAMQAPKIKGQHRGYLINALALYRGNKRDSSPMHRMNSVYSSNAAIEGLANYYAAQPAE